MLQICILKLAHSYINESMVTLYIDLLQILKSTLVKYEIAYAICIGNGSKRLDIIKYR